jgi:hypothetical protein
VQPKSCARPVARDLGSPRTALPNRCVSAPAPGRTAGFQPWRQGEQLFPPRGRRRPGDLACLPRTALPNRCVSAPAPGRTAGFRPWRQGEPLFPPRGRRRPGDLACLPRTAWANCWFSALAPGRTAVSAHRVPSARGTWPVRGPLRLSSGAWANRWFSALPPGRTAPGAYPSRVGKPAFRGLGLLTDHVADLLFLAPDALRSCCFCPGRTERMPGDFT